jgi:predicted Ser/Thr protein kinase
VVHYDEYAEEASDLADDEGMSGASYGYAVEVLAQCWIHGEQLRRLHNSRYQLGNEGDKANESGGVLNPAMLCISVS